MMTGQYELIILASAVANITHAWVSDKETVTDVRQTNQPGAVLIIKGCDHGISIYSRR